MEYNVFTKGRLYMKNIGIIGMGLIGGSMAKTIHTNTHYNIYGMDSNPSVIKLAIEQNIIVKELNKENAGECDFIIVALYPKDVVSVIREYVPYLKKGTIIVDCTGIKKAVCNVLSKELNENDIYFVGGHPMAGKEVSGYLNADNMLYNNASMILCKDEYTNEEAYVKVKDFFKEIGFPRIKESDAIEHDQVIAYTSQLAHVVSNAFIKSPTLEKRYGFSAGSFKDLTRVAKLNEYMWTDLFLLNKESLCEEIDIFMDHMEEYRQALKNEDKEELIRLLGQGRQMKENDEEKEINAKNS